MKHLGICTCNNRLNVHTGAYVATGKAIEYICTCNTCGKRNDELIRNNQVTKKATHKEVYYKALRDYTSEFENENGRKPNKEEMVEIKYQIREDGYGFYGFGA